ncbi:MAG: hypothetical protein ACKV0T_02630 [Planctomycetales bacterium]
MNASERQFVRHIRGRVKAEIASSAELEAAYQAARRARWWDRWTRRWGWFSVILGAPLVAIAGGVFVPVMLSLFLQQELRTDGFLGFIACVATILTLCYSQALLWCLHQSRWVTEVAQFPITDRQLAWRAWYTVTAWFAIGLPIALIAYGAIAWDRGFGAAGWEIALCTAVCQWLSGIALGTLLAVKCPRLPYWLLVAGSVVALMLYGVYGAPGSGQVREILYVAVPAGWCNTPLGIAWSRGDVLGMLGLPAVLLLVVAGIWGTQSLLRRFSILEFVIDRGNPMRAVSSLWPTPVPDPTHRGLRDRVNSPTAESDGPVVLDVEAAAIQAIRSRQFLQSRVQSRALCLWHLYRWGLTDREAIVFDALTGDSRKWCCGWAKLCVLIAILGAANWWSVAVPIGGIPAAAISIMVCMAAVGGLFASAKSWTGLFPARQPGHFVPRLAYLPLDFDEVSSVILKVNLLVQMFWGPILVAATIYPAMTMNVNVLIWVPFATGILILSIISQMWWVAFMYLPAARLPRLTVTNILWILMALAIGLPGTMVGFFLTFKLAVVVGGQVPEAWHPFLPAIGVILWLCWSCGAWWIVRTMYRRGIIDLVRTRPSIVQPFYQQSEAHEQLARQFNEWLETSFEKLRSGWRRLIGR